MNRKPIVVFSGEFWAGATGAGLSEGFRDLGWAVQEVDNRYYNARPSNDLPTRIMSKMMRGAATEAYRKALVRECRSLRPDVFFTVKGAGIDKDTIREIKTTGAKAIMYYPDYHFDHHDVDIASFSEYDNFITTKSFQVEYLKRELKLDCVTYVPHGYCDQVHSPLYDLVRDSEFSADVLYAGNYSPYKRHWLEGSASLSHKLAFSLVGNNWKENIAHGPLRHCNVLGERTGAAYAEAIQLAKINIAVHFGPSPTGWEDLVSTRTFEIPACRGFMLHIDNPEVREFFTPGVEVDVFSSQGELRDKIEFYIGKPDLREKMIQRAYERCVPNYSYATRAKQIVTLLKFGD